MIPEGLGAMLTMPIAGRVTDRYGARGVVLIGVILMCAGMGSFSAGVFRHIAYAPTLLVSLLVFGADMGCIMMPLSAAAVQTLRDEQLARGSTLINVSQRVAAAIGAATLAVILTQQFTHSAAVVTAKQLAALRQQATASGHPLDPAAIPPSALSPNFHDQLISDLSHAYGLVFLLVAVVAALTVAPAALPL